MTAAKSENRPKYATGQHIFLQKLLFLKNWIAVKKNLLTSAQKLWLKKYFKNNIIHLKISNLEGLVYLLKTGCQWRLLPEYYWWKQENQEYKAAYLRGFSRISTKLLAIFAHFTNYGRICVYDAFIKAHLANHLKSIIYEMEKFLCSDIHWHLRPCLTVMWLATRPYKHEQICSMTARLCFNIYYKTGS